MKRFTDTNKWRDPWFRGLSGPAKMLWFYLCDNCDAVGVIEIDYKFVSADTNLNITDRHLMELGERIQVLGAGKAFLRKFIHFQYGELTPTCPPHKKLLQSIETLGLSRVGSHFEHPKPLGIHYPSVRVGTTLQEEEKEEEKDKDQEGGFQRGSTIKGSTVLPLELAREPRFVAVWTMWLEHLKQKRKPATLHAQDLQLRQCVEWGLERSIKALETSVEHNWQGLYEDKQQHGSDRNRHITGTDANGSKYDRMLARKAEAAAKTIGKTAGPSVGA